MNKKHSSLFSHSAHCCQSYNWLQPSDVEFKSFSMKPLIFPSHRLLIQAAGCCQERVVSSEIILCFQHCLKGFGGWGGLPWKQHDSFRTVTNSFQESSLSLPPRSPHCPHLLLKHLWLFVCFSDDINNANNVALDLILFFYCFHWMYNARPWRWTVYSCNVFCCYTHHGPWWPYAVLFCPMHKSGDVFINKFWFSLWTQLSSCLSLSVFPDLSQLWWWWSWWWVWLLIAVDDEHFSNYSFTMCFLFIGNKAFKHNGGE